MNIQRNPQVPSHKKKNALIGVGACLLMGVLAFEAIKYTDAKTALKDQNNSLIVLPEAKDAKFSRDAALLENRINETKRLMFNRDHALENAHLQSIREKIQHKDNVIASLEAENQNLLKALKEEQEKMSGIEKSMNTLLLTLETQKNQGELAQKQQIQELNKLTSQYSLEKSALMQKLSTLEQKQYDLAQLLDEKESALRQLHNNSSHQMEALELASHQYTYDQISSNDLRDQNRFLENQKQSFLVTQDEHAGEKQALLRQIQAAQAELAAESARGELQTVRLQELEDSLKDMLVRFSEKDEAYQTLLTQSSRDKSFSDEALNNLSSDHEDLLETLAIERAVRVLGLKILNQENLALLQSLNAQKRDREALASRLTDAEEQLRVIKSENKYAHEEKNVILDGMLAKGVELEDALAIARLQNARESEHFQKEKAHLLESKTALEEEMGALLTHVEEQTHQVNFLQKELEKHASQITDLSLELKREKELSDELSRLKSELHQKLLAHQGDSNVQVSELQTLIQQKEGELSSQKEQEQRLLASLDQTQGEFSQTIQNQQKEIEHHKGQKEVLQEQIGALKDQLADEEQKNVSLQSDLAKLEMTLNLELNSAHQNYNQIIRELQIAIQNKEGEIQNLNLSREETHKKLNHLVQAKDDEQAIALSLQSKMDAEMEAMKNAFDQETKKVQSLEALLENQTTELQKLTDELKKEKNLSQELSQLERELQEKMRHTTNQKDASIVELQKEIQDKETQLSDLYFSQNSIKEELETSQKRLTQLMQDREDEKSHLDAQVHLLQNELKDAADAIRYKDSQKDSHTASLEQEIEEKQKLLTDLNNHLSEVNEKLETLMTELSNTQKELKDKDTHLSALREQISQLASEDREKKAE